MNIVHNCLDKYIETDKENQIAVKWEGEEGVTRALTYKQLQRQTTQMANGLRALGLKKGDAIGVYMPMTPEIVIAVLAIAKIGAVFVPLFSGYGAGAAAGVAIAKAMDLDVDQKFVNEVAENLKPNTSALFVLGSNANRAAVVNALKPYKGTLIQTTLSSELEDQLKRALSERD